VEFSVSIIILIIFVSFIAQFLNTALGEGFGTIVVPVFILLGFNPIQIVPSLNEAITFLVALLVYLLKVKVIDFMPVLPLLFGSVLAIPFAVRMVQKSDGKKHVIAIGVITVSLGLATLMKVL